MHVEAGLGDRSTRPHRSPTAIAPDVVSKTLYLRQHYHFARGRIADMPTTMSRTVSPDVKWRSTCRVNGMAAPSWCRDDENPTVETDRESPLTDEVRNAYSSFKTPPRSARLFPEGPGGENFHLRGKDNFARAPGRAIRSREERVVGRI